MKIVINSCYGGFSLSPLATKMIAKLQGKKCYFFETDFSCGMGSFRQKPLTLEEATKKKVFFSSYSVANPDEYLKREKEWNEMSDKEKELYNKKYEEINLNYRDIPRNDPLLLRVVKELGAKEASGGCALLKIITIPDDVEWEIEEYDGLEHVAEKHRTWP